MKPTLRFATKLYAPSPSGRFFSGQALLLTKNFGIEQIKLVDIAADCEKFTKKVLKKKVAKEAAPGLLKDRFMLLYEKMKKNQNLPSVC